jgi:hypothetical protein
MKVVLQNNMIIIRTGFKTMNLEWMLEYLTIKDQQILFLPKAVLIFNSTHLEGEKDHFLKSLAHYYAEKEEQDEAFFLKALLKSSKYPVRIELDHLEEPESVTVELYAHDSNTVTASVYKHNSWIMSFLRSQMSRYVTYESDMSIDLDVSDIKAKSRLEKALNKRHLLHYMIQYRYDTRFMQRLYADFADFGFENDEHHEQIDEMLHYFTVLECPVGASQDALKKSYKKLVKVYHPDRVHCESEEMVNHYTQKFQLLQEAYTALRIVS